VVPDRLEVAEPVESERDRVERFAPGRMNPARRAGARVSSWTGRVADALHLEGLFPKDTTPRGGWLSRACSAVFLVVGTTLVVARQPAPGALRTIWAEDGHEFLEEAFRFSGWATLTRPYRGYVQLFERLVAQVAVHAPLRDAAVIFTIFSALAVTSSALFIFVAARQHVPSLLGRSVLALSVVLLPIGGYETLNTASNAGWYFIVAAFWIVLWRPQRWWSQIAGAAFCFLAVGTDPLALVLLPIVALRFLALHAWREHIITAGFVGGAMFQLWVVAHAPALEKVTRPTVADLSRAYIGGAVAPVAGGERLLEAGWQRWGWSALIVSAGVTIAVLVVAYVLVEHRTRWPIAVAIGAHVAFFVVPMFARWNDWFLPGHALGTASGRALVNGSRYFVIPVLLLVGAIVISLSGTTAERTRGWHRAVCAVALGCIVMTWAIDFRARNDRSQGPAWVPEYEKARFACQTNPEMLVVKIPTTPNNGWHVAAPCRRLR